MAENNIEESKIEINIGDSPWEIACLLINAQYCGESLSGKPLVRDFFEKDELKRIGEHLVNYCKTEEKHNG